MGSLCQLWAAGISRAPTAVARRCAAQQLLKASPHFLHLELKSHKRSRETVRHRVRLYYVEAWRSGGCCHPINSSCSPLHSTEFGLREAVQGRKGACLNLTTVHCPDSELAMRFCYAIALLAMTC